MQTVTSSAPTPAATATGVVVQTAITAGGRFINHAEGIVVQTAIVSGGRNINHSETVVGTHVN